MLILYYLPSFHTHSFLLAFFLCFCVLFQSSCPTFKCSEKHYCSSFKFSIAILNGTFFLAQLGSTLFWSVSAIKLNTNMNFHNFRVKFLCSGVTSIAAERVFFYFRVCRVSIELVKIIWCLEAPIDCIFLPWLQTCFLKFV